MNPYPHIDICQDPDNCTQEHNETPHLDEYHHYGCECSDCLEFYRSLK